MRQQSGPPLTFAAWLGGGVGAVSPAAALLLAAWAGSPARGNVVVGGEEVGFVLFWGTVFFTTAGLLLGPAGAAAAVWVRDRRGHAWPEGATHLAGGFLCGTLLMVFAGGVCVVPWLVTR